MSTCSSGDDPIAESSGRLDVRIKNEYEGCVWEFKPSKDDYGVMVVNVTKVKLDCVKESFRIAGDEYCKKSGPFCIALSHNDCNGVLSINACANRHAEDVPNIAVNGKTEAMDHGFSLEYSFYTCQELVAEDEEPHGHFPYFSGSGGHATEREHEDDDSHPSLVSILVPVLLCLLLLTISAAIFVTLSLRRKKKLRKDTDTLTLQQYVSTVAADDSTPTTDVPSGSTLTLDFERSYEAVPRGTRADATVPIFSVIPDKTPVQPSPAKRTSNTRDGAIWIPSSSSNLNFSHSNATYSKCAAPRKTCSRGARHKDQYSRSIFVNMGFVLDSD